MSMKRKNRLVLGAFLLLVMGSAIFLLKTRIEKRGLQRVPELIALENLPQAFKQGGIGSYRSQKEALRLSVRERMTATDEETALPATQIAVYLFPDLLDESNFEKSAAEVWLGLEESIENEPRSEASRRAFEELRATIWNYESADRDNPQLSHVARKVLKLYDVLSAP